ncbi:component of small subunit processosome [Suhomyces tanzawaensis NRRL Y-17324]|uniref:U3 small nucleolar RNA-associated protein 10 n=1 Tax=Suhomyces tanzawaensis NRRL Y-17324 TaxID=984487 RepID=A0A1E4SED5_9ASCO|nr:component of small subunit processosome [Suhomyces tanzawaensis NRRL Y-17324]ODV77881.1 component of small subunit processosome [Suhomyces tanzawaensis NRRL Y-17324]
MSSLSQQLKAINAINESNASVALDRKSRSKIHSKSLIYEPKVAATQDYDYLYQVGLEGIEEITQIDSRFNKFTQTLFSGTSINLDRNVQSKDIVDQLNKNVEAFLTLIGPYLQLSPAIKALEWLVRRFHINIHNAELFLIVALPYHSQGIFVKILNVIPKGLFPKIFDWLLGYKELLKLVPSSSILKAFHNDFEIFKLYSLFLIEQIKNSTIYKEQLVFYLTFTVQLLASLSKKLETLNEIYMPVVLEVIGVMLTPKDFKFSSSLRHDIKLTSYSIIAVLGSIVPLSHQVTVSITESVLADPKACEQDTIKHTLIALGQLWNFNNQDVSENCFKHLTPETLVANKELISSLTGEYKLNKFLIQYFMATFPHEESYNVFKFIDLNESSFRIIFNKVVVSTSESVRLTAIQILESLLKSNSTFFAASLKDNNLKIDDLEMRLMTTLGGSSDLHSDDIVFDGDIEIDEDEEAHEQPVDIDLESLKTTTANFFVAGQEEFNKLSFALVALLNSQKNSFDKFDQVFASSEASISFYSRVAFSPSVPLIVRVSTLKHIASQLGKVSKSADLYLLVPMFLLGLADSNKQIRSANIEVLQVIRDHTIAIHSGKKKVKTSLYLEDQIYGSTEPGKRAIIPPQDALFLNEVLFKDDLLDDVLLDSMRINHILFLVVFKSSKSGLKKIGQLLLKTFILNQWSLQTLPIVFKWKIWSIMATENAKGGDDRFFFAEDLGEYFNKRQSLIEQADEAKISFFDEIEKPIVGLVGGDPSEKNATKEVSWIIQGLENQSANLQIASNQRLMQVFTCFKSIESRMSIINKLIELLTNEDAIEIDAMETLQSLEIDHELFIAALGNVQLNSQMPEQGVVKRRRRSSSSTKQAMARDDINNMASTHLKKLTVILDVLDKNLRSEASDIARPKLLQALFKILTDLDYLGNDGNLPVLYAQETLASCMFLSIVKMKASAQKYNFDSNSIRADLIVNSIRSSQSPQVQNRLLLVIAELASLAPEIILHSVMPIFTFMGAHTVRQDDEFSNSALQQTIAKVIPALAANGSSSITSEIEFLLTSFVAAFQHIPRHRRVKLFTSLTKTLGYDKSLHALLFLVGQQYVNNYNKNKVTECGAILEFTSSFLKSFSAGEQLEGIERFCELWDQIPSAQIDPNSDEYTKLSTRSIFGLSILSLNDEGLSVMKSQLLKFIGTVLTKDNLNYNGASSIKIKVALVLLDNKVNEVEKTRVLAGFRNVTSFLLSSLDAFTNTTPDKQITSNLYELLANFLDLLPLNYFVDSILDSLNVDKISDSLAIKVARNFAVLSGTKFESELNGSNIDEVLQVSILEKLLPVLIHGIKKNTDIELQQAYLNAFAVIVNKFGLATKELFNATNSKVLIDSLNPITSSNGLLSEQPELIISSVNAITAVVNTLGVKTIGFFPKIVPPALKIWKSTVTSEDEEGARLIQASIMILLSCLIKKIPAFMASSLDSILITILSSDLIDSSIRSNVLGLVVDHMDLSAVLKSLCNIWISKNFYENHNAGNLGLYLKTLELTIEKIDKKSASNQSTLFMKWLILAFEFRHYSESSGNKFDNNTIHRLESSFSTCGISYVMKLNDKSFRPLFANLVRWAVDGEGSNLKNTEVSRLLAFFRFFNKLQEKLKSIVTSYYSYLLDPVSSILTRFAEDKLQETNLRRIILNSLTSSFKYDQDDYWSQQGRFDSISQPLISQLANIEEGIGKYLVKSISSFVNNVASEEYNEKLVHSLIKHISNDGDATSRSKIWTIRTMKSIFQKMGEQWLTYLPTLIPYIAELLEDDDEAVEMESFLKSAQSLKPLFDRVLVQRLKPATQTASGIYIPEKNQEKLNQATVIASGPGITNTTTGEVIPTSVKAGDKVLLPAFGGNPVKIGEEEFLLYTDKEILAKIEN